jgi:hypothetical protein
MQLVALTNPLVLVAYAEACKRADSHLTSTRIRLESVLTSARTALQTARDTQLVVLQAAYDRAYNAAHKAYERESRLAGNHHGQSITRALNALGERQNTITAEHVGALVPLRAQYETATAQTNVLADTSFADFISPEHSPAHDLFKLAELALEQQREMKLAESHNEWLREKERCDIELADRMAVLEAEKGAALEAAKADLEQESTALLAPLERNLLTAQAQFDGEMHTATTMHNRSREVRLNIIENLSRCVIDADRAIARLNQ